MTGFAPIDEAEAASTALGEMQRRRFWLAVLAKASVCELEAAWSALPAKPNYRLLRRPEIGLAMVRGRIGGSGAPFNLGEMTMTRAAIQLLDDKGAPTLAGFGNVAGRHPRKAELVALFDALLQDPASRDKLDAMVIAPLAARQATVAAECAGKVMASKVDFFTMVRGE